MVILLSSAALSPARTNATNNSWPLTERKGIFTAWGNSYLFVISNNRKLRMYAAKIESRFYQSVCRKRLLRHVISSAPATTATLRGRAAWASPASDTPYPTVPTLFVGQTHKTILVPQFVQHCGGWGAESRDGPDIEVNFRRGFRILPNLHSQWSTPYGMGGSIRGEIGLVLVRKRTEGSIRRPLFFFVLIFII